MIKSRVLTEDALNNRIKLYAWKPNGFGEYSWFVAAENIITAKIAVENEMARRKALPTGDDERISDRECRGWWTNYYSLTISDIGVVISNHNE